VKKIVLLAVVLLVLLLLSNATIGVVLASRGAGQTSGNGQQTANNALQHLNVPANWQGKGKVVAEKGDLIEVALPIMRAGDSNADDHNQGMAATPSNHTADTNLPPSGTNTPAPGSGYAFTGYTWDLTQYPDGVPYTINPSVAVSKYGLSQDAVVSAIKNSFETWNNAVAPTKLWNDNPTINDTANASMSYPDNVNVLTWGPLPQNEVALSYMWMNNATKRYVDVDCIFNTNDKWGIAPNGNGASMPAGAYDIQNVCTHEVGHWGGLADLYSAQDSAETMYGIVSPGQTSKTTLHSGDLAGIQSLYPPTSAS